MRLALFVSTLFFLMSANAAELPKQSNNKQPANQAEVALELLDDDKLSALLKKRVEAGLGGSLDDFAKKFLVFSSMSTGTAIGLKTANEELGRAELSPVFPEFYKPTLAELFDVIALQTKSKWSYEKKDQRANSSSPNTDKPVANLIIITFQPSPIIVVKKRPYSISLAKEWTSKDRGHWEMYVPPNAPVGMDIYEMGRYSTSAPGKLEQLMKTVRTKVSEEWAGRVVKLTANTVFKTVKVGNYDALHFEAMIPSRLDKDVHWRQWVVTVEDRCFFIVSTLFPEQEQSLLPDVQAMLDSFKVEKP